MPDAIPGAEYYDSVFDAHAICNGMTERNGRTVVVLEYSDLDCVIPISFDEFKNDTDFELTSHPTDSQSESN